MAFEGTVGAKKPARRASHTRGFSLLELLIVAAIFIIVTGVMVINIGPTLRQAHLDTAYSTTVAAMDTARSRATSMRRRYLVTFTLPGTIVITDPLDATATPILTYTLPDDVSFDAEPGIPATTATAPDRLGNGQPDGPICFDIGVTINCSTSFMFYPDGSARDAAGNVNNGVVYLARPGIVNSSRAVSLFGLTGRIRGWRLATTTAGSVKYWRQQ
jgi:type II secretory pathway pseudopilin PulG